MSNLVDVLYDVEISMDNYELYLEDNNRYDLQVEIDEKYDVFFEIDDEVRV